MFLFLAKDFFQVNIPIFGDFFQSSKSFLFYLKFFKLLISSHLHIQSFFSVCLGVMCLLWGGVMLLFGDIFKHLAK